MRILAKRYVTYKGKRYFVKIFKYDWQKYDDECRTAIYENCLFLKRKLNEEGCCYSTELKDSDFVYFAVETIKRFLKRKDHEEINIQNFKDDFDGNYDGNRVFKE